MKTAERIPIWILCAVLGLAPAGLCADFHAVPPGADAPVDFTRVYLDGSTFPGGAARILADRCVYVVTNGTTFTGADGTANSVTGGSGLSVASGNATVYIYLAKGATLTCTGGKGYGATGGAAAPAPMCERQSNSRSGVDWNSYPFKSDSLKGGTAGSGAGGGGPGIFVPEGSKLVVFGEGTLNATGGAGGAAAAGGDGSTGLFSASTFYIESGVNLAGSPYKWSWANVPGATPGWAGTSTEKITIIERNAQPAGGAGGGGGGGGGGAAIGTAGAPGASGSVGGVNTTLWNSLVDAPNPRGKKLVPVKAQNPGGGGAAASAGSVYIWSGLTKQLSPGAGGSVERPLRQALTNDAYLCYYYDSWGGCPGYYLYFTEGQPGGYGGDGGKGAEVGSGGTGGTGGTGGDSGSLADSAWGGASDWAGESLVGANGGGGASGTGTSAGIDKANLPYGTVRFLEGNSTTMTANYVFGIPNESVSVPELATVPFALGWRVQAPLAKALPGVPDNAPLLPGDVAFYSPGAGIQLANGVSGDATLTSWTLTVQNGTDVLPFDVKVGSVTYDKYLSKMNTLAEMNGALAKNQANGLPLWQNLVLGFDPADPTTAVRLSIALTNEPKRVVLDAPSLSKRTNDYKVVPKFLLRSRTDLVKGDWTDRAGWTNDLPFVLVEPSSPRDFFKMSTCFTSAVKK